MGKGQRLGQVVVRALEAADPQGSTDTIGYILGQTLVDVVLKFPLGHLEQVLLDVPRLELGFSDAVIDILHG